MAPNSTIDNQTKIKITLLFLRWKMKLKMYFSNRAQSRPLPIQASHISNNNYNEAQVSRNQIPLKEKKIYLELIFLGKILGKSYGALVAYKYAISCIPQYHSAWNGITNYRNRYTDTVSKSNVIRIFFEILKLEIGDKRTRDILTNIRLLLYDIKSFNTIIDYFNKEPAVKTYIIVKHNLLEILKADIVYSDDNTLTIESYLTRKYLKEYIYNSMCISLGNILLQKKKFVEAFHEVIQLPFFSSNTVFRNWFCKYLCATFNKYETFNDIDIEKYEDIITMGIKHSKYPDLLNSMIFYDKKLYWSAFTQYVNLIDYDHVNTIEVTFILKCASMNRYWMDVVTMADKFLIIAKDIDLIVKLKKMIFVSYAKQKKWSQAINTAKEISLDSLVQSEQAKLAECYLENGENADQIINLLQNTQYYTQLQGLALMKQGQYINAISVLKKDIQDPVNAFYIAKSYWELECYKTSYNYLLKACMADRENADICYYIAMYNHYYERDYVTCMIFLKKARALNAYDPRITKHLSDLYVERGFDTANFSLLRCATRYLLDQSWLNFRLGVCYMGYKNWDEAIEQFLKTISINPTDIEAHKYLAKIYYLMGSFELALEINNKIITLDPQMKVYCLTTIGCIYSYLKEHDKAINAYQQVLQINPYYFFALKGITEAWIHFAKEKISAKLYHVARDAAQTAVNYLVKAISISQFILIYWKTLGEAILLITTLPDDFCFVEIKFGDDQDLGNLGTLYIRVNMYKLIFYCFWHGHSVVPPKLSRHVGRIISEEIFNEG